MKIYLWMIRLGIKEKSTENLTLIWVCCPPLCPVKPKRAAKARQVAMASVAKNLLFYVFRIHLWRRALRGTKGTVEESTESKERKKAKVQRWPEECTKERPWISYVQVTILRTKKANTNSEESNDDTQIPGDTQKTRNMLMLMYFASSRYILK